MIQNKSVGSYSSNMHNVNTICVLKRGNMSNSTRRVVNEMEAYHYSDVITSAMASQITNVTIVYSTVYSGANQRKHQSSASLPFVRGILR